MGRTCTFLNLKTRVCRIKVYFFFPSVSQKQGTEGRAVPFPEATRVLFSHVSSSLCWHIARSFLYLAFPHLGDLSVSGVCRVASLFLEATEYPSHGCVAFNLSPTDGYLGYFHSCTIINSRVMSISTGFNEYHHIYHFCTWFMT